MFPSSFGDERAIRVTAEFGKELCGGLSGQLDFGAAEVSYVMYEGNFDETRGDGIDTKTSE